MRIHLLIATLLLPSWAFAETGIGTGKVTGLIPSKSGAEKMFFVKIENISGSPACNVTFRFTMKSSDPAYKGTYSALLAALMSGIKVRAIGHGTCNNFSNSEDLRYICLGDAPC